MRGRASPQSPVQRPLPVPRPALLPRPARTKPRAARRSCALCPPIPPAQQSLPGFPGSATGQGGWAGEREQRSPSPSATHACFYSMRSLPPPAASDGAEEEEEAGKRRLARAGPGGGSGAQPSPGLLTPRRGHRHPARPRDPVPSPRQPHHLLREGLGDLRARRAPPPQGSAGLGCPPWTPAGLGSSARLGAAASGTGAFPPPRDARRGRRQRREADTPASSHSKETKINCLHLLVSQRGTRGAKVIPKIIAKMLPKAVDSLCTHVYASTVLYCADIYAICSPRITFPLKWLR